MTPSTRQRVESLLHRPGGCGHPAVREHAKLMLRIAARDYCATGCTAPATREVEGERLCDRCYWRMTR
jgi:hypothetical protein